MSATPSSGLCTRCLTPLLIRGARGPSPHTCNGRSERCLDRVGLSDFCNAPFSRCVWRAIPAVGRACVLVRRLLTSAAGARTQRCRSRTVQTRVAGSVPSQLRLKLTSDEAAATCCSGSATLTRARCEVQTRYTRPLASTRAPGTVALAARITGVEQPGASLVDGDDPVGR